MLAKALQDISQPIKLAVNNTLWTVYCIHNGCLLSGIISAYAIIHITLLWILHIAAIFWGVQFPFHSRYYNQTNRTRYVHIACVVVTIILPVYAPIMISLNGGFRISGFPSLFCFGRDVKTHFYTLVPTTAVLFASGTTMLLLILWRIRRVWFLVVAIIIAPKMCREKVL